MSPVGELPDETVRVHRVGRPRPRPRSAGEAGRPSRSRTRRRPARSSSPRRHPRRRGHAAVRQGVRRARRAPAGRRRRSVHRTVAGEGMGRTHRPVHRRGPVHHHDAAPQTRRTTGHRDGSRRWIPHPMSRWWRSTIRVRLTLWYAGAFLGAGAILVALMYAFLSQSLDQQMTARLGLTEQLREHIPPELAEQLRTQFEAGRADTLKSMLGWSLASLGVIGVAAGGFGWLLAGRALRPLQNITATARRVADRSLNERIALPGPEDEIKDLADTFDAMLERLDRAFDSQRRFVANASHELRTPLTLNRTLIEVALDDPDTPESLRQLGATLLAVNQRHERLIDGLLTLASAEERLTAYGRVDLADLVRYLATESLAAAEHGWVAVTTDTIEGNAILTVENTGPTVAPYEVGDLFEPFRRLTGAERQATPRGNRGAGLGLSIVRSVTHAHGGDLHATTRPDGGLTIQVRIPAVVDAPPEARSEPAPTRTVVTHVQ